MNKMTITELHIQLDLQFENKIKILKDVAKRCDEGYFFVDSNTGQCYLFDEYGNLNDIKKIKNIKENYIKEDITKIIIPNSITNINDYAFYSCRKLTNIIIPISVTNIGYSAFANCINLTNVTIPNNITSIKFSTFYNCSNLQIITIPKNVTRIMNYAFENCNSLKSLIFKGKKINQIKNMYDYPWGIKDESIIKCI